MIVGVADHAGWAVLVTVADDGTLVDRRRVELLDEGLPNMPHHHDAQGLPSAQAEQLVARVRASAEKHAAHALDAVDARGVALRECPEMPATVAERIHDYWAQNRADGVMYREAIAAAAEARGRSVHWYDAKTVVAAACAALGVGGAHFDELRASLGPPWQKDHKVAMAAAIVAREGS